MKKDKNAYLDTMQEIGILSMMNHPNIIRLYEVIEEE
jgi:serine/threonine protein kinase